MNSRHPIIFMVCVQHAGFVTHLTPVRHLPALYSLSLSVSFSFFQLPLSLSIFLSQKFPCQLKSSCTQISVSQRAETNTPFHTWGKNFISFHHVSVTRCPSLRLLAHVPAFLFRHFSISVSHIKCWVVTVAKKPHTLNQVLAKNWSFFLPITCFDISALRNQKYISHTVSRALRAHCDFLTQGTSRFDRGVDTRNIFVIRYRLPKCPLQSEGDTVFKCDFSRCSHVRALLLVEIHAKGKKKTFQFRKVYR